MENNKSKSKSNPRRALFNGPFPENGYILSLQFKLSFQTKKLSLSSFSPQNQLISSSQQRRRRKIIPNTMQFVDPLHCSGQWKLSHSLITFLWNWNNSNPPHIQSICRYQIGYSVSCFVSRSFWFLNYVAAFTLSFQLRSM